MTIRRLLHQQRIDAILALLAVLLSLVCARAGFAQSSSSESDGPDGDRFTTTRAEFDEKKYPPLPPGYTAFKRTVFILKDKNPEQSWSFIKFSVPSISDPAVFAKIRILRLEYDNYTANDATWYDRTFIEPYVNLPNSGIPHLPNFAARMVQSHDSSIGTYLLALYEPPDSGTADLSISATVTPINPLPDKDANITVIVTNQGPHAAEKARASLRLDRRTQIVSVKPSQGTCTEKFTAIFCNFGDIPNGASAQVFIVARPGNEQESWPANWDITWRHEYRAESLQKQTSGSDSQLDQEIVIDPGSNKAPEISIIAPVDRQAIVKGTDVLVKLQAKDTDGSVADVIVYVDGKRLGSATPRGSGRYEYVWRATENGRHDVNAFVIDNEGRRIEAHFVMAMVGPLAIRILNPTGPDLTEDNEITVTVTVSAVPSAIAKVNIAAGHADGEMNLVSSTEDSSTWEYRWTKFRSHINSISVVVTDTSGVYSITSPFEINIHKKPSVESSPYEGENGLTAKQAVRIFATVFDQQSEPRFVEFFVNGKLVGKSAFERALIPGPTSYTSIEWTPPVAGTYTLRAVVTNENGTKMESKPNSFRVAVAAPNL